MYRILNHVPQSRAHIEIQRRARILNANPGKVSETEKFSPRAVLRLTTYGFGQVSKKQCPIQLIIISNLRLTVRVYVIHLHHKRTHFVTTEYSTKDRTSLTRQYTDRLALSIRRRYGSQYTRNGQTDIG